jgi:hypothetical protein
MDNNEEFLRNYMGPPSTDTSTLTKFYPSINSKILINLGNSDEEHNLILREELRHMKAKYDEAMG